MSIIKSLLGALIAAGVRRAFDDADGDEATQDELLAEWQENKQVFAAFRLRSATFISLPDGRWGVCVPGDAWPADGSWEPGASHHSPLEVDVRRADGTETRQRVSMLFSLIRADGSSVAICEIDQDEAEEE